MKTCLLIVFNHRYDRNIPRLREYYEGKFHHIFFLMPFADDLAAKEHDVISVHHASYLFQGFFADARDRIESLGCDQVVIVGDDLLLNPKLNSDNLHSEMGFDPRNGYTKSLASLYDAPINWSRARTTYRAFFPDGLEWNRLLPSREEAEIKSSLYNIKHRPLGFRNFPSIISKKGLASLATAIAWHFERSHPRKLFSWACSEVPYPAFYGYSDFLVIPGNCWNDFAKYCEATTAMGLFVEAAIPLAMVLACPFVETELEYGTLFDAPNPKRRMRMRGIELQWQESDRIKFETKYNLSMDRLIDEFPDDVLYYHPVKLSKWK